MKFIEELDWILDPVDQTLSDDEKYRRNIAFVHSLGLKCDCVGWSKLKLSDPRADEILEAIAVFCKTNGWHARGCYARCYCDYESDWYELMPIPFRDATIYDAMHCEGEHKSEVAVRVLRAYHETKIAPKRWGVDVLVPERFRDACLCHHVPDVDFCWATDKGRYEAEQYFHMYGNDQIPYIAEVREVDVDDRESVNALGGSLPKIADIFYKLQQSDLQDCYLEADLPACLIAHAYTPSTFWYCGKNRFLIHKRFAEILLQENAVPRSALRPAAVVKEIPGGYTLRDTQRIDRPLPVYRAQSIVAYEKLKNTVRPARVMSEKEALRLLRATKGERKEEFQKAMPKTISAIVTKSSYAPLVPYYSVADGGVLSNEYRLFSYDDARTENDAFAEELRAEELVENLPQGVVFAICPDGDRILLCENGNVIRFSHEEPVAIAKWPSLAQFIVEAIND